MDKAPTHPGWKRHFVRRAEVVRTTWKFRIGVAVLVIVAVWLTRAPLSVAIAHTLVCTNDAAPSDAILVDNLDPDYLTFEHASALRQSGIAPRVLVPVQVNRDGDAPGAVALGTAELMARISRIGTFEVIPIKLVEPFSLNAAQDVLRYLRTAHLRSVIVVTPMLRSRRTMLVYEATLGRAGINVRCEPVPGTRGVDDWTATWHGMQQVAEQWLKLHYYKLYVLPFRMPAQEVAD